VRVGRKYAHKIFERKKEIKGNKSGKEKRKEILYTVV